jgi:hypothetical protein
MVSSVMNREWARMHTTAVILCKRRVGFLSLNIMWEIHTFWATMSSLEVGFEGEGEAMSVWI